MSHNETHIRVAGFGGQGIMMFGQVLAHAATIKNQNALWFPSYGPETRGGTANCQVIISDEQINSPIFKNADHLIVFNHPSVVKFQDLVSDGGLIIYNKSLINEDINHAHANLIGVAANEIALDLGNNQVANMVMMGTYLEITNLFDQETIEKALIKFLGDKKRSMVEINLKAIEAGRNLVK